MLPSWQHKQLWRPNWVLFALDQARESGPNGWHCLNFTVNRGMRITESWGPQRKQQPAWKSLTSSWASPHQRDWHISGSRNSKDKTVFGFVTPQVFCRQVWFSLSIDSEIKSGPLLSLRQAMCLDIFLLGVGMPKYYMVDCSLLVVLPCQSSQFGRCHSLSYPCPHTSFSPHGPWCAPDTSQPQQGDVGYGCFRPQGFTWHMQVREGGVPGLSKQSSPMPHHLHTK